MGTRNKLKFSPFLTLLKSFLNKTKSSLLFTFFISRLIDVSKWPSINETIEVCINSLWTGTFSLNILSKRSDRLFISNYFCISHNGKAVYFLSIAESSNSRVRPVHVCAKHIPVTRAIWSTIITTAQPLWSQKFKRTGLKLHELASLIRLTRSSDWVLVCTCQTSSAFFCIRLPKICFHKIQRKNAGNSRMDISIFACLSTEIIIT